jgi:hypothetical protein
MGLSLQKLHEIEEELQQARNKLAPLRYRKRKVGRLYVKARYQAKIDAVNEEIQVIESRLLNSWGR